MCLLSSLLLCSRKTLSWFQSRVYEWDPNFKFPNRIIGTAIISLIGLYTVRPEISYLQLCETPHPWTLFWGRTACARPMSFLQMTLADYSLSNMAFDQVEKWKNTLQHLVTACNRTEALGAMIPQLEEFIDVARSELVCTPIAVCCIPINRKTSKPTITERLIKLGFNTSFFFLLQSLG